jgi:hypothetical protein
MGAAIAGYQPEKGEPSGLDLGKIRVESRRPYAFVLMF